MLPGVVCIGGVYLFHFGLVAAVMLYNVGLVASVANAMWSLLKHRRAAASSHITNLAHPLVLRTIEIKGQLGANAVHE